MEFSFSKHNSEYSENTIIFIFRYPPILHLRFSVVTLDRSPPVFPPAKRRYQHENEQHLYLVHFGGELRAFLRRADFAFLRRADFAFLRRVFLQYRLLRYLQYLQYLTISGRCEKMAVECEIEPLFLFLKIPL